MALQFKGKAWVFGDNLNVDKDIVPFRERELGLIKPGEFGKWCMTPLDPDFPKKVRKGDIMVVGSNMGCGQAHYSSNEAIKQCGIACVIAESFDRNFFRNSIAVGLPIIEYKGIKQKVKEEDILEVDLRAGKIRNRTTKKNMEFTPLPDFLLDFLEAGGAEQYGNKLIAEGKV